MRRRIRPTLIRHHFPDEPYRPCQPQSDGVRRGQIAAGRLRPISPQSDRDRNRRWALPGRCADTAQRHSHQCIFFDRPPNRCSGPAVLLLEATASTDHSGTIPHLTWTPTSNWSSSSSRRRSIRSSLELIYVISQYV